MQGILLCGKGTLSLPMNWYKSTLLRIIPPVFPVIELVGSNAYVANRSIKPNIENHVFKALERDRNPPF